MKKFLAVTAVATLAGFIGLWIKNKQPRKVLPRQQILEMLRKIDQESYIILCQMAACVTELLKKDPMTNPDDIKVMFESPESGFPDLFSQLYSTLYAQFSTNEEEFEYSIEHGYPNDPEVQFYRKRLAQDFHKAILGSTPNIDRAVPIQLAPHKVLGLVSSILNRQLEVFGQGLKRIKTTASVKQFQLVSDSVMDQYKKELFAKQGLDKLREDPSKILEFAVGKYLIMDEKFKGEYQTLHRDFSGKMEALISSRPQLFTIG